MKRFWEALGRHRQSGWRLVEEVINPGPVASYRRKPQAAEVSEHGAHRSRVEGLRKLREG